jgi:hypothetical protein
MNTTHIKIESDALVCMICAAAFIGYVLGIQKMVNAVKPHQHNKYSQTNLSELAELLTLNHMVIHDESVKKHLNDSNAINGEETKINEVVDHSIVESRIVEEEDKTEGQCQAIEHNKDNQKTNESVSEIIINNSGNVNNSEEDYEVVNGSVKKIYTKKQPRYYFGWFDSMF